MTVFAKDVIDKFNDAVEFVLKREGGLSENPNDSGGTTNFGISLRFIREIPIERLRKYGIFEPIDENTIKSLTIEQAKLIYRGEFWDGNRFDEVYDNTLRNYIFDMAVQHGIARAIKIVQRAICADYFDRNHLKDDGILGDKTLQEISELYDVNKERELLRIIVAIRAAYYRLIVEQRPKEAANLNGWLNRCYTVD